MPYFGLLRSPGNLGIATDLYQLTMAAAYFEAGMGAEPATFELSVRRLPPDRGYLIAAGLAPALEYLTGLRFDGPAVDYLRSLPAFGRVRSGFWELLREFRFEGDAAAVPEGTAVFPDEPLLQVTAPLLQAQLVETFLLATINHQTLIATKAARVVEGARGKSVVEFGARRAHGFESAVHAARAAYIGGCAGTSNLLAGRELGIPVYGTAAHSFIMAFPREEEAFAAFHRTFPGHAVLLVDTYDTVEGARRAAAVPGKLQGVRLDSGDIAALAVQVRDVLDRAGRADAVIVASGDLDEHSIDRMEEAGVPIDIYGVGTELTTSRDAPALSGVYKLVEVLESGTSRPVRKHSPGKSTWPGVKQVWRSRGAEGRFAGDLLALRDEPAQDGEALLEPVLSAGKRTAPEPPLAELQARARVQREALPDEVRRLVNPAAYPVTPSKGLRDLTRRMDDERMR